MRAFRPITAVLALLLATGTAMAGGDFHRDGHRRPASHFGFFLKLDDGRGFLHHQGHRFHRPPHLRHDRRFHGGRGFHHGHRLKHPDRRWQHGDPHWKRGRAHWKRGGHHWKRHPSGHRRDRPARLRFRHD